MLHHLTLWVPDLGRAEQSWSWLLGCLGYERDAAVADKLLFRHRRRVQRGAGAVDRHGPGDALQPVPPGLNHLAFRVDGDVTLGRPRRRRARLRMGPDVDRRRLHPIAGGADVAYLEDRDGFEVELVS